MDPMVQRSPESNSGEFPVPQVRLIPAAGWQLPSLRTPNPRKKSLGNLCKGDDVKDLSDLWIQCICMYKFIIIKCIILYVYMYYTFLFYIILYYIIFNIKYNI